jgi:hypothetical protein
MSVSTRVWQIRGGKRDGIDSKRQVLIKEDGGGFEEPRILSLAKIIQRMQPIGWPPARLTPEAHA